MRIALLGPLEVGEGNTRLGARDRAVLSALAMSPGRLLSPEQLAEAVWGDDPPPTWPKSLQGCISRLRKLLGPEAIRTTDHGYRLHLPSDVVDAVQFDRGARRAEELLTLREFERARYVATQALDLWRGRPLAELEQWDEGSAEAGRLTELRAGLEEISIEASLAAGHHREVLARAARMVEEAPLRERRWALLARAQYQAGQQSEALRTLHRVGTVLRRELGLDPGPELVALEQAILRQDPDLFVAEALGRRNDASPYPGLRAYAEGDAESFFGRETEIRTCLERLQNVGLLAIVGPSGSGKSSLLRAGIVPALREDGREVAVLTPGSRPADSMSAAQVKRHSVLLVDQAEEAFSLCPDEDERRRFFDALVAHTERGQVVLAMRADFTGELAQHPALAGLVERGLALLGAMSPDSLRAAVEGPAGLHGLMLEPGLVDLLVQEVEGEPGALPLMSHALRETWLRHEGRTLTVAGYQASGGIRGAVAQSAEALYDQVRATDRRQLRELVLRLVVPGPGGEPVRSRVPRQQAVLTPAQEQLVELMVAARLVTTNQGDLELAHEALVRAWPRLRGWLDDDVEGQRLRHRLTQAAGDWDGLGRHESELYRGARLAAVTEWVRTAHPQLSAIEEQFFEASAELAAAEEELAREQVARERTVNRQLRVFAGGLAVLLALALVTGVIALHQSKVAQRAAVAADASRVGTAALLADEPQQSLMMAVAGARLHGSGETDQDVRVALASRPLLVRTTSVVAPRALIDAVAGPSGLVVTDLDHGMHLLDPRTLQQARTAAAGNAEGEYERTGVQLALSGSMQVLAVASERPDPHPVRLYDPATLHLLPRQLSGSPGPQVTVMSLSVSGNGRYLAAALAHMQPSRNLVKGRVVVWDLRTRRVASRLPAGLNPYEAVALDQSGRRVFVNDPLTAYDTRTGRLLWQRPGDGYTPTIAAQPGGHLIAELDPHDNTAVDLRSTRNGRLVRVLPGHQSLLTWIAFSHDGSRLAASGNDGLALVWDAASGAEVDSIQVGGNEANTVAFSSDDHTLYTIAEPNHQVSAWDLTGRRTYLTQVPLTEPWMNPGNLRVSPDGSRVATIGYPDGTHAVWHLVDFSRNTTRQVETPRLETWAGASWAPDGTELALGWGHGIVELVDGHNGQRIAQRKVLSGTVVELSFSRNGAYLLATDTHGDVARLDPKTLEPLGPAVKVPNEPEEIASSPDGRYAFVLTASIPARYYWDVGFDRYYLVDLRRDRIVRRGDAGVAYGFYEDFSPDGRHVTVGGRDGQVAVIDLATGTVTRPTLGSAYSGTTISVHYNPSGSRVLVSSGGGQLAVLDGRTGNLVAMTSLSPTEGGVASTIAPDGTVVAVSKAGHMFRWNPSAAHALDFACSVTGRGLDQSEWSAVLPNEPWRQTCPT